MGKLKDIKGVDVTRWLLLSLLGWSGRDFLILSPWFGQWDKGFTPTIDYWTNHPLLPRWALYFLPTFWNVPGWFFPSLLIALSIASLVLSLVKKRTAERISTSFALFVFFSVIMRYTDLRSQADWWLLYSLLWLTWISDESSPWMIVFRVQCVVIYFMAGIGKLMEPSWRSGNAILESIAAPFAAFPRAEDILHWPMGWIFFLAWLTIFQRVLVSPALLFSDLSFRGASLIRRASSLSFAAMHLAYGLLLDVGTFSTVGLACQPALWAFTEKQKRPPMKIVLVLIFVILCAPVHWLTHSSKVGLLPPWDMFVKTQPEINVVRLQAYYGDRHIPYDPLLKFFGQDPLKGWDQNPYHWNKALPNWRMRFWLLNVSSSFRKNPQGQVDFSARPITIRFLETLTREPFTPDTLLGLNKVGWDTQIVKVGSRQM